MQVQYNVDLKPYTTFGLSSIAEKLVHIRTKDALQAYFHDVQLQPSLVLGGGSNMLLSRNIAGTVLKVEIPGIEVVSESADHVFVRVGAGVEWHQFVLFAIDHGWGGVENLSLIPGSTGAAPMQNIGAYGVEIKDVFHSLEAYLTEDRRFQTFDLTDCHFGYRESIFKRALKNKAVIASVTFKLSKHPTFNTSYGAIEQELDRMGVASPSLRSVSDAVIAIRRSKLPDPKELGNAGSFFKNPVIDADHFAALKSKFSGIVGYEDASGGVKVAAGWLIENAGFKGKRFGNCGVHEKQALVLVNYGGATGQEIFQLSEKIIAEVLERFDILLEREVNIF